MRFNISKFESLTSVIKDGIKCLLGQNEDAEEKAYELRQQDGDGDGDKDKDKDEDEDEDKDHV